jgi:hypothetical protein
MEFATRGDVNGRETRSYINADGNVREFSSINNDSQAGSLG